MHPRFSSQRQPRRSRRPDALPVDARGRSSVVRHAVTRFAAWSLAVLVLVAVATLLLSRPLAESLALREATTRTATFTRTIVAPLVDDGVLSGDDAATAPLVRLLRARMADGSITHMKIWTTDGRVVWSDEAQLIGRSFELEEDISTVLSGAGATADVSALDKAENRLEQSDAELIEVYVGFRATTGQPLVFEAYWPTERIQHDVGDIRWQFTGLGLAALLLLALALLPLAVSLARRVDRGLAEREAAMAHALSASDLERRRLSQDLHDGLVQDIVGVGYALPSVAAALPAEAVAERALLDQAAADLARSTAGARDLLTDLYPADLDSGGLEGAVEDLADRQRRKGVTVDVEVDPGLAASRPVSQLVYRVVREALRNVDKHAFATQVGVSAVRAGDEVVVEVRDDGVGLPDTATTWTDASDEGHLGLRLLRDTLATLDGRLDVQGATGGGVVVRARFPAGLGAAPAAVVTPALAPPERT